MVTVILREDGMELEGHAGTAGYGADLVCAAVSALVYTLEESLRQTGGLREAVLEPGYARVLGRGPAVEVVAQGLRLLAACRPEAVLVKNGNPG